MKKICLLLSVVLMLSVFVFAGCKGEEKVGIELYDLQSNKLISSIAASEKDDIDSDEDLARLTNMLNNSEKTETDVEEIENSADNKYRMVFVNKGVDNTEFTVWFSDGEIYFIETGAAAESDSIPSFEGLRVSTDVTQEEFLGIFQKYA